MTKLILPTAEEIAEISGSPLPADHSRCYAATLHALKCQHCDGQPLERLATSVRVQCDAAAMAVFDYVAAFRQGSRA